MGVIRVGLIGGLFVPATRNAFGRANWRGCGAPFRRTIHQKQIIYQYVKLILDEPTRCAGTPGLVSNDTEAPRGLTPVLGKLA